MISIVLFLLGVVSAPIGHVSAWIPLRWSARGALTGKWSPYPTSFPSSTEKRRNRRMLNSPGSDDNDNDSSEKDPKEPLFYDDFGEIPPSSSFFVDNSVTSIPSSPLEQEQQSSPATLSVLQQRMQQVAAQEEFLAHQVQQNWLQGNWHVRGFSLDTRSANLPVEDVDDSHDPESQRRLRGAPKYPSALNLPGDAPFVDNENKVAKDPNSLPGSIYISTCVVQANPDDEEDHCILWLGRTDGSVVAVRCSDSETWAQFITQIVSRETGSSFTVQPALVRQRSKGSPNVVSEEDPDEISDAMETEQEEEVADPFDIVAQVLQSASTEPVEHILPLPQHHLVLSCSKGDSVIQPWVIPSSSSGSKDGSSAPLFLIPQTKWDGVHQKELVALYAVPLESSSDWVCSVSKDGRVALWDASNGGDLTAAINIFDNEEINDTTESGRFPEVSAAHVTSEFLYIGTSTGRVLIYAWSHVLEQVAACGLDEDKVCNIEPAGQLITSNDEIVVTALTSVTTSQSRSGQSTTYLAAGNTRGVVKQFQLFERGERVESWPKMATQRLQGKAHLFQHYSLGMEESRDENQIVDLQYVNDGGILLTASVDTIRCWNTASGKESHCLSGFEKLSRIGVLPSPRNAFATNGMKNVLSIHDYSQLEDDDLGDDDFDVSEYLDFDE